MQCSRCQRESPSDAEFCPACGARLVRFCTECGNACSSLHRFCTKCGHPLAGAGRPPETLSAAPDRYTPRHLAEKILTSRAALEGERKQVTVLFADVQGSLDLLAERDPEEVRALLDPVLERMMDAVHRYEGTVNQVMGDGIMALFGAPLAHEDHAVRACYAALQMQEAVQRHAEDVRRREGLTIQIRVGLNSGEVVVRSVESDLRMDYSAVGRTTHLAGRMEQLAAPGSVLMTAHTQRAAEGYVVAAPVGPVRIKGLAEPLDVYQLQGVRWGQRSLQARVARGLTPLIGREVELEQLRRALEQARDGHGQVVAVVGEPGVGKSRLLYEFTHSPLTRGWLVLESGGVPHGRTIPYLPVIELLKSYFHVDAGDDGRAIAEKVGRRLAALDERLAATLPALVALLNGPVDDPQWPALDPQQRRRRTLEALQRLVLRESQAQPVLLVMEDLHWIDSETEAVLQSLVERLAAARVLLLVNYRPEHQHAWAARTYYTQLPLEPLPAEGTIALLRVLLGDDVALQSLKRQLIDRTEGNPFFLEESVRTLVETGVLTGRPGAYRLARAAPTIEIPTTIQAVLAARVDRLPAEDKRLLQCAAIIGKDVPFELLQAIVDLPEEATRRRLTALRAAEFLYETRLFPAVEYTFKHALTHEVAYASILLDRRRAVHAAIAAAIERLYPDRLGEHVERLAHHALRSEQWDKAAICYHRAAARAMSHSAYREAVAGLEHALDALHHLPETPETLERGIDLRSDLRAALFPLGEFAKLLGYVREAERLGRLVGDRRRLAWVSAFMIPALWSTGQLVEALEYGRTAGRLAVAIESVPLQAVVHTHVGMVWTTLGDTRRAEHELRSATRLLAGALADKPLGRAGFPAVLARVFLAMALADRGRFDEAFTTGRQALQLAETFGHSWPLNLAWWSLGYVHGIRGEVDAAIRLLERCLTLARDGNVAFFGAMVAWFLGRTYVLAGRGDEGLALLRAGRCDMEAMGLSPYHTAAVIDEADALALGGRLEEALACGTRAARLACERGQRGHEALARRLLGAIASRRDPPDVEAAEHHYGEAMALAGALEMRPLLGRCRLELARLHRRLGRRADDELAAATTMLREMDMTFWIGRAEAAAAS